MNTCNYIPRSPSIAGQCIRSVFGRSPDSLSHRDFMRAWCAIAYLYPGLHPDGFEENDSGWPKVLRPFAAEAWRRAEAGELSDEELYPCDAQWAGLFDRMTIHTRQEMARRKEISRRFGPPAHG